MTIDIDHWARVLIDAVDNRHEITPITKQVADLPIDAAYDIQAAVLDARVAAGDRIVGAKLGLTSKAKQAQMGVDSPVYGFLLASARLAAETPVELDELIHPRCEPEIVFVLGEDLDGPDVSAHDVLDTATAVCGGIEVIDSRYEAFSFTHADVIADNTSAARFVVGPTGIAPRDADLSLLGCLLEVDGDLVATAAGAALLGHPAECVALLARHLSRRGQRLKAGWTILAGGLTDAVALAPGIAVTATYARLGLVTLTAR